MWEHAPQGAGLRGASAHFLQLFEMRFKQKSRPKVCLKMRILGKKTEKIASASGDPLPNPSFQTPVLSLPTTVTTLVEFDFCTKYVIFPSKKNKMTTVNVLLLPLPHVCTYFSLQPRVFVDG